MQRMTRTKAALVTTAIMSGGMGAVALLPGTAMAAQLPSQHLGAQSPPLTATAGSEYQYTFAASGDPSWTLVGAPSWLSISGGTVSGTVPRGTTSFSYSVTVTNGSWSYTEGTFTVQVSSGYRQGGGSGYTQPTASLSSSLTCPSSVRAGKSGSCTLTVTNSGPGTARDVTATIDLPSGLQAETCGESADWRWGWNGSDCTVSGNDATAQLRSIGSGQSGTVSVYFRATGARSWRQDNTVEVTASAQAANGYQYGVGTPWGMSDSAQSTAYVSVYGGRRY